MAEKNDNSAAWNAAGQAASAGIAAIGQSVNTKNQFKRSKKLMEIQMQNQELMNDSAMARQMKMWEDTNYQAQVGKMKEAGLNPALLYGMSGGGGATTGSVGAGSASGGHAPQLMDMGSITQAALAMAQAKLLAAQTDKTKVETEKIGGVDTEEAKSRIENLTQGVENQKANQALTKAQTIMQDLQNRIGSVTERDQIDYITYQTQKALKEVEIANHEEYVNRETRDDRIKIIQEEAVGTMIQNALNQQKITESKQNVEATAQEILQKWETVNQQGRNVDINQFREEIKAINPTISQIGGKALDQVIMGIQSILGTGDYKRKVK